MNEAGEVGLGGVYEGEKNAVGESEGFGVYRNAAGDLYRGQWRAGNKEGRGTYWFADGSKYDGEYKDDLKEGWGRRYSDNCQ